MSVHVFPKGNDRSWTREFYYTVNRVFRWMEYKNRPAVTQAVQDCLLYGTGYWRVRP
jgi:hypothetical protein